MSWWDAFSASHSLLSARMQICKWLSKNGQQKVWKMPLQYVSAQLFRSYNSPLYSERYSNRQHLKLKLVWDKKVLFLQIWIGGAPASINHSHSCLYFTGQCSVTTLCESSCYLYSQSTLPHPQPHLSMYNSPLLLSTMCPERRRRGMTGKERRWT